jgi:Ni,Fe-hydrogenase III large subunit
MKGRRKIIEEINGVELKIKDSDKNRIFEKIKEIEDHYRKINEIKLKHQKNLRKEFEEKRKILKKSLKKKTESNKK